MAKTILPVELLNIEDDGIHLVIRASVNNRKARMLVDTGASKTVFDKELIKKFTAAKDFLVNDKLSTGLGTNHMQTHTGVVKKFQLGDLVLSNHKIILLDLSHVNESYCRMGLPVIDGVLGSDVMMDYQAVIDYKSKQLVLKWKRKYL